MEAEERGEKLPQPAVEEIDIVRLLQAVADPVRLHLLRVYAEGHEDGCSSEALDLGYLHKSTISHHLRVMREAGLTSTWAVGRQRIVRLRRADLEARFPGLLDSLIGAAREVAPQRH